MKDIQPHLMVDVSLYATSHGGPKHPIVGEWFGCPCKVSKDAFDAWDCRILLRNQPMSPGDTRRIGIVFLSRDQAVPLFRAAGKFFLWEGGIIGEATVLPISTIHVSMADEGTEVWRPVAALEVGPNLYCLEGPVPADEKWKFQPGQLIEGELREFTNGVTGVVAVRLASSETFP